MKKVIVKQSNSLIEASYKLSLQEKRLIVALITTIKKDDEDFKTYTFKVEDLAKLFGISKDSFYKGVQEITVGLQKKILKIQESDGTLFVNWLSSSKYRDNEGIVELCFSPKLKPYLLQVQDKFTMYALEKIAKLKSVYSIRIYELLKQYENMENKERYFSLEDLKLKIGVIEYDEEGNIINEKFKTYGAFKKYVLLPTQKEINKETDINFSFKEKKYVRKVIGITFSFKDEQQITYQDIKSNKFTAEMEQICIEIEEKAFDTNTNFSPKVFVLKAIKNKKHPDAILHTLKRLNEYWNISKENPWAYGQSVLNTESKNYNEKDTIKEHEKLKKEGVPTWLQKVLEEMF